MTEKKMATPSNSAATTKGFEDGPPPVSWDVAQPTASQKLWQKSKETPFVPIGEVHFF